MDLVGCWVFVSARCSEALCQHSGAVMVKTHQQFAEKAAEPAAATMETEALFTGS